jgi:2-keto-4-pentenoate hydratase/2-oxohepta-3-ene-1,7-dioic acid hydratase in catechol pathway
MSSFQRLVRFKASDGQVYFGEAPEGSSLLIGQKSKIYSSNPLEEGASLCGDEKEITEVLSPLPTVPIFYGIGLNYRQHAAEGGVSAT